MAWTLGEDVGVTKEAVAIKKGDSDTAKAVQAATIPGVRLHGSKRTWCAANTHARYK